MKFTPQDEESRAEMCAWLAASLVREFADLADTIHGGSDEIRHNVITSRALGLPGEPT